MLFGNFRFATIAKYIQNPQALYVRNGVGASLFIISYLGSTKPITVSMDLKKSTFHIVN